MVDQPRVYSVGRDLGNVAANAAEISSRTYNSTKQMLTYLRYALATFCFTASVGCLALGWRSQNNHLWILGGSGQGGESRVDVFGGYVFVFARPVRKVLTPLRLTWAAGVQPRDQNADNNLQNCIILFGHFGTVDENNLYFPLWYPALIFALAGVAALRFRRQFSIRSALIAVTVVAALLGMVVAL
jgi:hypothetical protein